MRNRRAPALLCALGLVLGAAACGGDDESDTPVATAAEPTVAEVTEAAPPVTASGDLADRLPAGTTLEGTDEGEVQGLDTAAAFTGALYADGDPSAGRAAELLDDLGFAGAVLRDDRGTDPQEGLALHRIYVLELGGEQQARAEVIRSAQEILQSRGGGVQDTGSFPVPGIPGATGVFLVQARGDRSLAASAVIFPLGPYVYGFQAVAVDPFAIDRTEQIALARARYDAGR